MKIINQARQTGKTTFLKFLVLEKVAHLAEAGLTTNILWVANTAVEKGKLERYFEDLGITIEIVTVGALKYLPVNGFSMVIIDEVFSFDKDKQELLINEFGDKIIGIGTLKEAPKKLFSDYIKD